MTKGACVPSFMHITLPWWYLKKVRKIKKMRFGQSTAVSLKLGDCMFSMLDHVLGSLPANHSVILVIVCGSVHNEQGGIHNQAVMTCINITWPQT